MPVSRRSLFALTAGAVAAPAAGLKSQPASRVPGSVAYFDIVDLLQQCNEITNNDKLWVEAHLPRKGRAA